MALNREIPNGWQSLTVDALALKKKGAVKIGPFGSQLKKNELRERGVRVYGQENVIQDDFRIGGRFIDQAKFDSLRSVELSPGDVVLTMMGSVGAATVVPDGIPTGIMDSHLLRIQPNTSLVEPEFLARVLRDSNEIKKQIHARSQGGIMSGLNAKIVRSLDVPIPPLRQQRKITAILSSVDDAIEKTQAVIDQVQVVKRGLMQELLTGGLPGRHTRLKRTRIGPMPQEWTTAPGIDLFRLSGGYGPKALIFDDGGECLFVKVDSLNNRSNRRQIRHSTQRFRAIDNPTIRTYGPGSLVFPKRGAAIFKNRVRRLGTRVAVDPNLMVLTPTAETNPEFLLYLLLHIGLFNLSDNSGIPQLNNKHCLRLAHQLPIDTG